MVSFQMDQLKTLEAVVDEGTFEAAARALQITPSAVSQRVKALEQQVGRIVVQRSKPIRPTESGEVLMKLARQLTQLELEAYSALGLEGASSGPTVIPLAVNADSLATWILPTLARIAEQRDVTFDIRIEDQDHSTALLREGVVVAAITSVAEPVQGCIVDALGSMQYRARASPRFADRWFPDGLTHDALAHAPMVVFDRKDDLQARYLRGRSAEGTPPRHFVPASGEFVHAVALGLGWGMLPEIQIGALHEQGELVDLDPAHPIDLPLFWQQWNLESSLLAQLAGAIRHAASGLAPTTGAMPATLPRGPAEPMPTERS